MEVSIEETTKRALAVEAALTQLVIALVGEQKLKAAVGLDMLRMLSLSSIVRPKPWHRPLKTLSN